MGADIVITILSFPLLLYCAWHFCSLVLSLIARQRTRKQFYDLDFLDGKVAILYPTCNDFKAEACCSLAKQSGVPFDLFILDDSTKQEYVKEIDAWSADHLSNVIVVRRKKKIGHKGANINNWFDQFGNDEKYPYFLVVDADECVDQNFTQKLVSRIQDSEYAFVQACHIGTAKLDTLFRSILHVQAECEWLFQVPGRNISGMPPMLGHGTLMRTKVLQMLGGFPNLVSEDLALTIMMSAKKLRGLIAPDVIGYEEFPETYHHYWRRRRRWIEADTEIVKSILRLLWIKNIPWVPRIDLTLRELRLSIGSLYWLLLILVAIAPIVSINFYVIIPSYFWILIFFLIIPIMPILSIGRIKLFQRLYSIVTILFVGASTIALHPVATVKGLFSEVKFIPTGSQINHHNRLFSFESFWEYFCGTILMLGGILTTNLGLVALGVAIFSAPLMRTRFQNSFLIIGSIVFFLLIFMQLLIDIRTDYISITHLLVFSGIAITLI